MARTCVCGYAVPDGRKFCESCGIPSPKPNNLTSNKLASSIVSSSPCVACGKTLDTSDTAGVFSKDVSYHLNCLACVKCSKKMTEGEKFSLNFKGKPVCATCVDKCAGCDTPCKDSHSVALDQTWHKQCFRCFECKTELEKGFYEEEKRPFCSSKCIDAHLEKSAPSKQNKDKKDGKDKKDKKDKSNSSNVKPTKAVPPDLIVKSNYKRNITHPTNEVQRQEFTKGGILEKFEWKGDGPSQYEWGIVNTCEVHFSVTFDFSGSARFDFHGPEKQTFLVKSGESRSCVWGVQQEGDGCKLGMKFNAQIIPLSDEEKKAKIAEENKHVQHDIDAFNIHMKSLDVKKSSFENILSACQKNNVKFVDKDFPPVSSSLFDRTKEEKNPFGDVCWRRASEFLEVGYDVFEGGVSPNDIHQGKLGDCWFMCSIASVAENEHLIQDIFLTKKANIEGCYQLRLCVRGEWTVITLDDYFPCYPGGGPMFSRNNGPELWVLLLEKAYAKIHGNYALLRSGQPKCGMQDLTGCPVEHFNMDDDAIKAEIKSGEWWKKLLAWGKADLIMAAGTSGEDHCTQHGVDPKDGPGLVSGHAYTIIDVKEAGGVKLLNIRNPWGRFEWNGAWGDESSLWTEQMKALFKPVFAADGCFWMSYEDFLKFFSDINVCFRRSVECKEWSVDREVLKFEMQPAGSSSLCVADRHFLLNIPNGGHAEVFAALHQADKRIRDTTNIDFGLMVCEIKSGKVSAVLADSRLEIDRDCQTTVTVPSGTYRVIPYSSGLTQRKLGLKTVSVICSVHLDIKVHGVDYLAPCPANNELLAQALQVQIIKAGEKNEMTSHLVQYQYIHDIGASFFVVAIHMEPEFKEAKALSITLDYSQSTNAVSSQGSLKHTKKFVPGDFHIMHWMGADVAGAPFSLAGAFEFEGV